MTSQPQTRERRVLFAQPAIDPVLIAAQAEIERLNRLLDIACEQLVQRTEELRAVRAKGAGR